MALLRLRSRLAALALLFASPGLAGLAVDAAHPCPEQAPWTVEDGSHHHDQAAPEHHDCKCVGACQTPVPASAGSPSAIHSAPPVESSVFRPLQPTLLSPSRPGDRLPPATAPPLV